MITPEWLAGFFDGEGCILVHRTGRSKAGTLCITINNTHPGALQAFASFFGGKAHRNGWQNPKRRKDMWRWLVTGPKAERALELMLPHLIVKKDEAYVALMFLRKEISYEQADSRLRSLKRMSVQSMVVLREPVRYDTEIVESERVS